MDSLPNLWPWSVWLLPLSALAVALAAALCGRALARLADHRTLQLARELQVAELRAEDSAFVLGEGKNLLLVGDGRLTVIDAHARRVVQQLTLAEVASLKLYEAPDDRIGLRLVQPSGARTRKLSTDSITRVAQLCNLLTSAGKDVQYVEE